MIHVWTIQSSALLFHFLTLPFLLILVITLALGAQTTHAEPAIGPVLSNDKSLLIPVLVTDICPPVVTTPSFMQAISTQAQTGSGYGIILEENGYVLAVV